MWTLRKPIKVDNIGLIKVEIPFEDGMKSDFSDVRFFGADETTVLDYLRQSYTASTSAVFLVDCPDTNIYCYFGDPSASYIGALVPGTVIKTITHENGYVKHSGNPIIPLGTSGQWDDYVIYGSAPIEVSGTIYNFYGGSENVGANPRLETSVGLSTSTDGGATWTKQGKIIDKSVVVGLGITPYCIREFSGTYYLFMSVYNSGATTYNIGYMTSTDLLNWSGYTVLTGIDSSAHAPCVIDDPTDNTKIIIYYTGNMLTTPTVKRATALKSNPASCSNNTSVLGNIHSLYPWVTFNGLFYEMLFTKPSTPGYTSYKTASQDGLSFPDSNLYPVPNGGAGSWDLSYVNMPRTLGNLYFYSARSTNAAGAMYVGVGMAEKTATGGVIDWGWGSANVSSDTTAHSGTTKYVYRKSTGSFTATSITRTTGWHKLTYEINEDIVFKIDDVVVATETIMDTDNVKGLGMYGYTAGTAYFDDYEVIDISTLPCRIGTEDAP
jgi:hypothetical protein